VKEEVSAKTYISSGPNCAVLAGVDGEKELMNVVRQSVITKVCCGSMQLMKTG
jgi:hypothetical protein